MLSLVKFNPPASQPNFFDPPPAAILRLSRI